MQPLPLRLLSKKLRESGCTVDIGCETPPCTLPQLSDTFYSFGSELQALRPSLYAAFGQTSLPTVAIVNHSANAGLLGRVYAESSACLHLVLANTDTGRASSFTAAFSQPVPTTATILFTADYSVQLASHNLTDWVAPGQTNVYRIGGNCTVLKSDEHIHVSPHHRREQPVGRDYSVPPAIVHAGQQTFGLNVRDFGAVGDGVSGAIASPFGCACRLADHRLVPVDGRHGCDQPRAQYHSGPDIVLPGRELHDLGAPYRWLQPRGRRRAHRGRRHVHNW